MSGFLSLQALNAAPGFTVSVTRPEKNVFDTVAEKQEVNRYFEEDSYDPETEIAILGCIDIYARGERTSSNFSALLNCLSYYIDYQTLRQFMFPRKYSLN